MKQTWLKGERDSNTIVVRNNTSLSDMDRTTTQFNKEKEDVNNPTDQLYKNRHSTEYSTISNSGIYIFLKSTQNILQDRPHVRPQNKY